MLECLFVVVVFFVFFLSFCLKIAAFTIIMPPAPLFSLISAPPYISTCTGGPVCGTSQNTVYSSGSGAQGAMGLLPGNHGRILKKI